MARDPSKTENATPKRLKKARNDGNVAKSQELSKTVSILSGLIILTMWLGYIGHSLQQLFRHFMTKGVDYTLNEHTVAELGMSLAMTLAKMMLPVLLFIALCAYVALRLQVGKLWTTKVFKPKWGKFNPIKGLQRMLLSKETFIRLFKSMALAVVIGIAPIMAIKAEMVLFPTLYYMDAAGIVAYILALGRKVVLYALWPMVIIAVIDLFYSRWSYKENLKMTKDEVKDERKQAEGDPKIRAAQRKKMMEMSMARMMQQVPKADVVITNPTHIAVALRYNAMEAPAPVVVAMGANQLAERIKKIARENNVPVRENKPLARALYKQTEVGDMIPAELFQAVAIILAQIWKTKNTGRTITP
ncbi:flagellar biosynthesis protein FlhB [Desulfovibrio sp. OttesenSCG-928-A18]|nr:flagellar biosynthesis protein FlhB [Desulfovibrio sp. OttesenSCG-928-A18]